MIEFKNVEKVYPGGTTVKDASLTIDMVSLYVSLGLQVLVKQQRYG